MMKVIKSAEVANPVNNREASKLEVNFIENGRTLGGSIEYKIKQFSVNRRRIQNAFFKMIKSSPILQTRVIKDADGQYTYKATVDSKHWPTIEFLPDSETNKDARKLALEYQQKMESQYKASIELRKSVPCRAACCYGESLVFIVLVSPHHFLDGVAFGSAVALKLMAYVRVPRGLWPFLDRLFTDREVPTYEEMYLKSDFRQSLDQTDGSLLSHLLTTDLFKFNARVACDISSRHTIGMHVKNRVMNDFRKALRDANTTVSCAFCALSIKLMFLLVDTSGASIVALIPGDARKVGRWGDKRRDNRKIPIVGNFPFAHYILSDPGTGKASDIPTLSRLCRRQVQKANSDAEYRTHLIQHGNKTERDYFCGISSVRLPSEAFRLGIAPTSFNVFIDFGEMPRVWFYVITIGPSTRIAVDFNLPGLGTADLKGAIKTILQESKELLPCFNQLHALQ